MVPTGLISTFLLTLKHFSVRKEYPNLKDRELITVYVHAPLRLNPFFFEKQFPSRTFFRPK